MLQKSIVLKNKHQQFVDKIVASGSVWALQDSEGFATSSSNEFEDESGNPIDLMCFWSDIVMAKVCAKNNWSGYQPMEIKLEAFIEDWCIGMYGDDLMVGTNFDWNMIGFEIEPLELILEILQESKATKKELLFEKFESTADLKSQITEILSEAKTEDDPE